MDNRSLLIVAMADKCRRVIGEWNGFDTSLPKALQRKHLLWMCDQIEEHAEIGAANKFHRWLGFVQGAMLAHRMLSLEEIKAMFDDAKYAHGQGCEGLDDLESHLDPSNAFEFELGGQG